MPACGQHKSRMPGRRVAPPIALNNFHEPGLATALRNGISWRAPVVAIAPPNVREPLCQEFWSSYASGIHAIGCALRQQIQLRGFRALWTVAGTRVSRGTDEPQLKCDDCFFR